MYSGHFTYASVDLLKMSKVILPQVPCERTIPGSPAQLSQVGICLGHVVHCEVCHTMGLKRQKLLTGIPGKL